MNDPFKIFAEWFAQAQKIEKEPTAMNLATVGVEGKPSSRIVLLKSFDERGLVFFTNSLSRKGRQLSENQNAALNFFWPELHKQIRIEGATEEVKGKEADDYYHSRELGKRIGAWGSLQSQILPSREELLKRVEDYALKFGENPPRPEHWHGYRLKPEYFEFWQEGESRLHDREIYERKDGSWSHFRLYP